MNKKRMNKLIPLNKSVPTKRDDRIHPMFSFQKEINHLFENFFEDVCPGGMGNGLGFGLTSPAFFERNWDPLSPKVDISESENQLLVAVELPGMSEEDFELSIQGNVLTVKGEKRQEAEEKQEGWYRVERHFGSFERSIPLPHEANVDDVDAEFKNGVLKISLSKVLEPPESAKRIDVRKG